MPWGLTISVDHSLVTEELYLERYVTGRSRCRHYRGDSDCTSAAVVS